MNYQAALDYIFSFTNYEKMPGSTYSVDFDLRRVRDLLRRLGEPHREAKSIHVAGTKGKGSTTTMIAAVLSAAGFRVGLYTSPHLHTLCERIRVGDDLISDREVSALVEELSPEVDVVNRLGIYGQLTTFEILTALAFAYFKRKQVEFQVLEVGLGGRLDATNVINPDICVITPISLDHTDVLGDTLAAIAREKAGIIKPECTVVSGLQPLEAMTVIEQVCQEKGAKLIRVGSDVTWEGVSFDLSGQSLEVKGRKGSYYFTIPLLGDHQLENASTAVAVIEALCEQGIHISPENISSGMSKACFSGRFQVFRSQPSIVIDGAHNADSAKRLREAIAKYFHPERLILVMGVCVDKDIVGIVEELLLLSGVVIATRADHPRAMSPDALAAEFSDRGSQVTEMQSVASAVECALKIAGENELICITGSFFVVAEAIEYVNLLGDGRIVCDVGRKSIFG